MMEAKEIIEGLKQIKAAVEWDYSMEYQVYLDEAIARLDKADVMSDLISREDAVNAICHHLHSVSQEYARQILHEVPSAEQKWRKAMSDLISRDRAIEELEAWAVNLKNPRMYVRDDAIHLLKNLPSAQQWIPCSERLPRYGDYVLVQTRTAGKYIMACDLVINPSGNYNEWSTSEESVEWDADEIVAWMPLPEYKEESDE